MVFNKRELDEADFTFWGSRSRMQSPGRWLCKAGTIRVPPGGAQRDSGERSPTRGRWPAPCLPPPSHLLAPCPRPPPPHLRAQWAQDQGPQPRPAGPGRAPGRPDGLREMSAVKPESRVGPQTRPSGANSGASMPASEQK